MNLLIDAGNTRTKMALYDSVAGQRKGALVKFDNNAVTNLESAFEQAPDRVFGSIVAGPKLAARLEQACKNAWGLTITWLDGASANNLLRNPYKNPRALGADRWLALLGLLRCASQQQAWLAGCPYMLASFGTATTIDTIYLHGGPAFCGGLILPGHTLMVASLANSTAQLPFSQGVALDFPTDTHNAIASGVAAAQIGAVLQQWRLAANAWPGKAPQLFVSGGSWPNLSPTFQLRLRQAQTDCGFAHQPAQWLEAPVLDGLALAAAQHS